MTPTLALTGLYAAILALMAVALQIAAIAARARHGVLFGDGGNLAVLLPVRRHGNFVETVPLALILMLLAEAQGLAPLWLHASGLALVAGRAIHPFGLRQGPGALPLRIGGSVLTWAAMAVPVGWLLV
jgi:Uncharacterized relative of glutathione S-transferase, MAPEG superfamily